MPANSPPNGASTRTSAGEGNPRTGLVVPDHRQRKDLSDVGRRSKRQLFASGALSRRGRREDRMDPRKSLPRTARRRRSTAKTATQARRRSAMGSGSMSISATWDGGPRPEGPIIGPRTISSICRSTATAARRSSPATTSSSASTARTSRWCRPRKKTGAIAWKTDRKSKAPNKFSFSTPLLVNQGGREQIISPSSGFVGAYDPKTGPRIWRADYQPPVIR